MKCGQLPVRYRVPQKNWWWLKSIHSSRNSLCVYCVCYLWNQNLCFQGLLCVLCAIVNLRSAYLLSSGIQHYTEHCIVYLRAIDLDLMASAGSWPFSVFFSTLVSLSTRIPFAIFECQPHFIIWLTSNFTRRLRPLTTNSFNFPNARNGLISSQYGENDQTHCPCARSTLQLCSGSSVSLWPGFCFSDFTVWVPFFNLLGFIPS